MMARCFARIAAHVAGLAALCWLLVQPVCAAPVEMKIDVGSKVIYCEVALHSDAERLIKVLREGTEISFTWEISIEEIRQYWLNSEIASVRVTHRVVPDLVSQSWQLIDMTSGITRRVFDVKQALAFLTHLEHFPVIDRSLLEEGERYRMLIQLEEHQGSEEEGWFTAWLGVEQTEAALDFSLP